MADEVERVEAELEALEAELCEVDARREEVVARLAELGPVEDDEGPELPPDPVAGAVRAMLRRIATWQLIPLVILQQALTHTHGGWDYAAVLSLTSAAAAAVYGLDRWAADNPEDARELRRRLSQRAPRWWAHGKRPEWWRRRYEFGELPWKKTPKMRVPALDEQKKEKKRKQKRQRERARWDEDRRRRRRQRHRR